VPALREILHIADVHFGPHFLERVGMGVERLIETRRPDLVVIAGDLTQRAKVEQFRQARAFVDRLPVPSIVVPGNHDVPMYRVWERVFAPYGVYRKYFAENMEPVFEDDALFVVGINTAFNWTVKDGRFTSAALRRVRDLFAQAPPGKTRLVVAHHHLAPPPRFETRRLSDGSHEALLLFAEMGVEMVFSGHLHQTWIGNSQEYFPNRRDQRPVLLVHCGTTTSGRGRGWERGRNSANWVTIGERELVVRNLLWDPELETFREWSRHHYPRRAATPYELAWAASHRGAAIPG
jgi:3',5'-cyclic AMP phosphodiesterase CpdA